MAPKTQCTSEKWAPKSFQRFASLISDMLATVVAYAHGSFQESTSLPDVHTNFQLIAFFIKPAARVAACLASWDAHSDTPDYTTKHFPGSHESRRVFPLLQSNAFHYWHFTKWTVLFSSSPKVEPLRHTSMSEFTDRFPNQIINHF